MEFLNFELSAGENIKRSPWIYSAVGKIASAFSLPPLVIQKRTRQGWQDAPAHKANTYLRALNPEMHRWALDMHLAGEAYWIMEAKEYVSIPVKDVLLEKDGYLIGGKVRPFAEVLAWRFPHPDDKTRGLSPIAAIAGALRAEQAGRTKMQKDLSGKYRTILLSDKLEADQFTAAADLIEENWDEEAHGPLPKILAGASGAIEGEKESVVESQRLVREEIASALGIPTILLSLSGASKEDVKAAESLFWEEKIIPLLMMFCMGLERHFLKQFKLNPNKYRIRPDLSDIPALCRAQTAAELERLAAESVKARADSYDKFLAAGTSAREAAKLSGLKYRPPIAQYLLKAGLWLGVLYFIGQHFGVI